jgi:hypothetical protein
MTGRAYDGAPREITEDEARQLAHEEYVLSRPTGIACYRGADGGYHAFDPVRRGQDAIAYLNVKRRDLRERLMAGKCTHTCFYDRARDRFYLG